MAECDMNILLDSSFESFLQLIWVLLIFIFVLAITYFTTRWIGGYQKAHSNNKNLAVVETIRVGNNKMICIVRAGIKYLVVSVGKDEVHLLAELSKEELAELPLETDPGEDPQESFQEVLNKLKDKLPKKQG
jgi:flagellar protein FliO/FliZ